MDRARAVAAALLRHVLGVTLPALRHVTGVVLLAAVPPAVLLIGQSGYDAFIPLSFNKGPRSFPWSGVTCYLLLVAVVATTYVAPTRLIWRSRPYLPQWALVMILSVWCLSLLPVGRLLLLGAAIAAELGPRADALRGVASATARYAAIVPLLLIPLTMPFGRDFARRTRRPLVGLATHVGVIVLASAAALLPLAVQLA